MKAFLFHRGAVAEILEIQISCQIISIFTVRNKPVLKHLGARSGVLDGINICLISGNQAYLAVSASGKLLHGNNTGHGGHIFDHIIKIHVITSVIK